MACLATEGENGNILQDTPDASCCILSLEAACRAGQPAAARQSLKMMFDQKLSLTPANCAAAILLMNQAAGWNNMVSLLQVLNCGWSAHDNSVFFWCEGRCCAVVYLLAGQGRPQHISRPLCLPSGFAPLSPVKRQKCYYFQGTNSAHLSQREQVSDGNGARHVVVAGGSDKN